LQKLGLVLYQKLNIVYLYNTNGQTGLKLEIAGSNFAFEERHLIVILTMHNLISPVITLLWSIMLVFESLEFMLKV